MKHAILLALLLAGLVAATPTAAYAQKKDDKQPAVVNPAALSPAKLTEKAPEVFKAHFDTSKGKFIVEVFRKWSPNGADRFYNLVKSGYFTDVRFFRIVPNFVVQFGIHGTPEVAKQWQEARIEDDPVVESNKKGYLTFAKSGQPNSRTTQFFINLKDNGRLDNDGFSPFGRISKGMEVVEKLYSGYGEMLTSLQGDIVYRGNDYLKKDWPKLDYIKKATIVK